MQIDNPTLAWIASEGDTAKHRLPGTSRARPPSATLEMAVRAAAKVGVTRIADVTRLDTIGIATFQAVRPAARTLAVSQGKGVTPELAKLSAVMESIELWHAEQPLTPDVTASPAELRRRLGYPVDALPRSAPSLLHDRLPLDWVAARSLIDGSETLVPVGVVRLLPDRRPDWNAPVFLESTNGLASGNTLVESALHGLYEVVERDAVTAALTAGSGGELGVCVDPRKLGSAVVDELCAMIERAGVALEVRFLPSPTDLPCFHAWLACDDYPVAMYGFGCHLSAEIALTRAVTEAAQTRLTYISGARDDLDEDIDAGGTRRRRALADPAADIRDLIADPVDHESLLDDLEYVVKRAAAAFCHPPLLVDLTREEIGVPVVKVIAPGSRICQEAL